jgi:ParB-like chromosome segregation protein Spo0J
MTDERRIEAMPLGQIKAAKKNPKQHSAEIGTSVGRFGYVEPIVLDERTGRIVAGHGRREALMAMRKRGDAPPAGIKAEGDEWLVPVLRGWASRSDAEADAYLLASNKLTEAGGWDDKALAELLKDLEAQDALDGVGFTDAELQALLGAGEFSESEDEEGEDEGAVPHVWQIVIECANESEQEKLLERFIKEGVQCRALTS